MSTSNRLVSLDAFRGLTILGMIIVNNPGDWFSIYPPLSHAEWAGCTPTDLVFPFFLFIMGFSLFLSITKRLEKGGSKRDLLFHLLKRSLSIFLIGLFLNAFPFTQLQNLRIPGVLQRIALVNLFCGLLLIYSQRHLRLFLASLFLLAYWILLEYIPSPLSIFPTLAYESNWAAWVDQSILGKHVWSSMPLMDPEGILSTFPAFASGILGIEIAFLFSKQKSQDEKTILLFVAGFILTAAGLAWSSVFPMVKKLWTSSYVLYTTGLASMTLAFFYYLVEKKGKQNWVGLLTAFGVNPLALYVGSDLLIMILWLIPIFGPENLTLSSWFFRSLTSAGMNPLNASLLWAILYTAFWACVAVFMHRKRIIIKL